MSDPTSRAINEARAEVYRKRKESDDLAVEVEKRRQEDVKREIAERSARELRRSGPAPEEYLPDGSVNPVWRLAHPLQQVLEFPDPGARSWSQGNLPIDDGRSEADRLNDPKTRFAALEARLARLEDIMARQLGVALETDRPVYR